MTTGARRRRGRHVTPAVLVMALVLGAGCGGPVAGLYPPRAGEPAVSVWIVAHGWHAGIAVRASDVPPTLWPERAHFPGAEYVEVGWGDRDYWQAAAFPGAEIVEIRLSRAGFERLLRFVDDTFARTGAASATPLGPAPWPHSRFYPARGNYHLFRTSNTWTARALREAGLPIMPAFALTSGGVMRQARRHGAAVGADAEATGRRLSP